MCGICGIALSSRSSRTIDRETIARMCDIIAHRGPDGAGIYLSDRVALGHRRLSIIDVEHGAQPMASDSGAIQLTYNGEVYNHPTLYEELKHDGVTFHTHCDTETILRIYEREGRNVAHHLRGMFAFAIWDAGTRELLLVRDRFGVKPLYYAILGDGSLLFASEIKSILASGFVRPVLNREILPDFLANRAPTGSDTFFAGIRRLPPAHTLIWKDGAVDVRRYWALRYPSPVVRSDDAWVAEYRDRFRESVRLRLMSDVPLGMFLSGGIDSASITAMMSQLVRDPIKTFSVAFREREANELGYARLVATQYRTDHHEIVISARDFLGALPRLLWHEDEPIAHSASIALNFVSQLAAQYVKVVLTGEGSDETLAGYNRYRVTAYNVALARSYQGLVPSPIRGLVRRGVSALSTRSKARRILSRTFLYLSQDLDATYFDNFAVFSRARQAEVLAPELCDALRGVDPYAAAHAALTRCEATSLVDQLLFADIETYLHELLMKQDQMSMAASIESRVPFLDHPLVEFTATMPERMKLRGVTTKYVLRRAMRGLVPSAILTRRKMGFPVPIGTWFRGEYRHVIDEFVLGPRAASRGLFDMAAISSLAARHLSGQERHDERLWLLVNLEVWQRIFLDGESFRDVKVL
jgi:asparagine synthase (glutamine-hydrolysing)